MNKWFAVLLTILLVAACSPAQGSLPEIEPTATGVLESVATETPKTAVEITETVEPTETAVAEQPQVDETDGGPDNDEQTKPGELPANAALIFQRSGGFAGLDQQWIIYTDGRIDLPDGAQKQVDAGQVQTLLDTIQAANFFEMNESYVPLDNCCDRFTYSITVQMDGQSKTVTTIDDAPKQPEQLTTVMNAINLLLSELE